MSKEKENEEKKKILQKAIFIAFCVFFFGVVLFIALVIFIARFAQR